MAHTHSPADCLAEYRRLTQHLGRFPTPNEFDRLAVMSFSTLRRRVGTLREIRHALPGPEADRWDVPWLIAAWNGARIALAEQSSQLQSRSEPWDIAWVYEHDWPGAPRTVLSCRDSLAVRRARLSALARRRGDAGPRPRRLGRATRAEILGAMRNYQARCHDFDQTEFMAVTGITHRDISWEFASWADLRQAAGFRTARTPVRPRIPDSVLLDAWVDVKHKLGRIPAVNDIRRHTRFSHLTYYRRFGRQAEIIRRGEMQEQWRALQAEMARERDRDPDGEWARAFSQPMTPGPVRRSPHERLQEDFARLTVGAALTSRMTADWRVHPDILVCVQHDWPAYPRWTVEVAELRHS